jgi:SAM-dependent methyltransferase
MRRIGASEYCPFCERSYRFRSFGRPPRARALCPGCRSLERHRLLWLWLTRTGVLSTVKSILHFAPEPFMASPLSRLPGVTYISADSEASDYAVPGQYKMDITDIRFPDESFDLIIASHILEHVPDDRKAMRELRRVVTASGIAVLLVPYDANLADTYEDWTITAPEERERAFGQHDHVRMYAYQDYMRRLRECGWDVHDDRFVDSFAAGERQRYALPGLGIGSDHGSIFVCRRGIPPV